MSNQTQTKIPQYRPERTVAIALYLFFAANVGRTVTLVMKFPEHQPLAGFSLGLEMVFIVLYSLVLWKPHITRSLLTLYFLIQSLLILAIFARLPAIDFVTSLFIMLSFQAALQYCGRTRWIWIGIFVTLTGVSSMLFLNPFRGLALGLLPMAVEIVLTAYIITTQEVESARAEGQAMLLKVQETHRQLKSYAEQIEDITAIEERNRLARELHDSVSQTMFSISLNTRAAQLLLEKNPAGVRVQLEQLQKLVQSALAELRSLITQLRTKTE